MTIIYYYVSLKSHGNLFFITEQFIVYSLGKIL